MAISEPVATFGFIIEMDSSGECFSRSQNENMPAEMVIAQLQVLLKDYGEEYHKKYSAKKP